MQYFEFCLLLCMLFFLHYIHNLINVVHGPSQMSQALFPLHWEYLQGECGQT